MMAQRPGLVMVFVPQTATLAPPFSSAWAALRHRCKLKKGEHMLIYRFFFRAVANIVTPCILEPSEGRWVGQLRVLETDPELRAPLHCLTENAVSKGQCELEFASGV